MARHVLSIIVILISKFQMGSASCTLFNDKVLLRPEVNKHGSNKSKLWIAYIHSDLFSVLREESAHFQNLILNLNHLMKAKDLFKDHLLEPFKYVNVTPKTFQHLKAVSTPIGWFKYPTHWPFRILTEEEVMEEFRCILPDTYHVPFFTYIFIFDVSFPWNKGPSNI